MAATERPAPDAPETYPFGSWSGLVPPPRYAQLRENPGLVRISMPYGTGTTTWLVTRHADVRTVLADRRFSRARAAGTDAPRARPPYDSPAMLIGMDPPNHTRVRRLVAKAFTVRRVESLRPRVQEIVTTLLDRMASSGPPADLAEDLAWPLPVTVICELLGVPARYQERVREWTELTMALGEGTEPEEITTARERLNDVLAGLIAERRASAADDLLSALVRARDDDDQLSEDELIRLGVTLLISGHETTANQISNFAWVLLSRPDRWDDLVARGVTAVPRAVEELLRFVPLGASADFARIATEDVEVGGQLIRAGDAVLVEINAANRDDRAFGCPNDLDLGRSHRENPHLAFGHGLHHCLGAPLARMELQVVLTSLLEKFPTLHLAVPASDVPWRSDRLVNGPRALPVSW